MRWFGRLIAWYRQESDLDREVRFHIDEEVRLRIERGEPPDVARRTARQLFGNVGLVRDATRRTWRFGSLRTASSALGHVYRSLRRHPALTVAAILTFALGIGANIAVFAMFDRLLFRPLPYPDSDRLVLLHSYVRRVPSANAVRNGVPSAAFLPSRVARTLAEDREFIAGLATAEGGATETIPAHGEEPLYLSPVSRNALMVLGLRPALGGSLDDLTPSATVSAGTERLVMLTHETWQQRYRGSPDVLDMAWVSGAAPYRVVGVLPRGFLLPTARLATDHYDGIVALNSDALRTAQRGAHLVAPFARLRPGVSIEVAQARIDALVASAFQDEPWGGARGHERKVIVQPLQNGMSVVVGPYLWLVVGAVWAVLGVSCFSLSTLLLTWGQARQRDAGIRLALGASPPRLLAAAFLESCAICLAGASLAWLGYVWGRAALIEVVPPALRPFAVEPGDPRVVVATIAVATLVACIAGAVPALRAYRADVLTVLRPTPTASRLTRLRGTAGLVSLQSAFGIVLVVGAATTVPAFVRLLVQSPGFEVADLHLVNVRHNWSSSESAELLSTPEGISRVRAVLATMAAVPGVTGVAATTASTLTTGNAGSSEFWRERGVRGHDTAISGELFQTLGVAMWAGRAFEDSEALAAAPVAVLNETGAQSIWPGRDPAETVGLTISTADGVRTVVGIVADFRSHPAVPIAPELFIPISATEVGSGGTSLEVIVRASPGQRPDRRLIEERLNATFPKNTVQISSVADAVLPERIQPRFLAVLFGSLAAVTLVLVAAGLYGLADYEIGQRRREMSIRLALGATARDLRRRILALVVAPVLVGTLAGGFVSWWAGSIAGTMLPHVDANDPRTYAAGLLLMLGVAVSAALLPARRLSRMRPSDILRLN